ncbi:MAG: DUF6273 domain-containing protein [Bifidobacteriaceae bacterium]|jgi:hypothetical protein|nr:DUF6273 domain-containing protein [Bifidobacteriaceae bacterium]
MRGKAAAIGGVCLAAGCAGFLLLIVPLGPWNPVPGRQLAGIGLLVPLGVLTSVRLASKASESRQRESLKSRNTVVTAVAAVVITAVMVLRGSWPPGFAPSWFAHVATVGLVVLMITALALTWASKSRTAWVVTWLAGLALAYPVVGRLGDLSDREYDYIWSGHRLSELEEHWGSFLSLMLFAVPLATALLAALARFVRWVCWPRQAGSVRLRAATVVAAMVPLALAGGGCYLVVAIVEPPVKPVATAAATPSSPHEYRSLDDADLAVGDWVKFGLGGVYFSTAECSTDGGDWFSQDIGWLVADRRHNQVLLVAEQVVCTRSFDASGGSDWASSDLRVWLNDTFRAGIPPVVRAKLMDTTLSPEGTEDEIFLLGNDQVAAAEAWPSEADLTDQFGGDKSWWWRSAWEDGSTRAVIPSGGRGVVDPSDDRVGVRPAIWLSLGLGEQAFPNGKVPIYPPVVASAQTTPINANDAFVDRTGTITCITNETGEPSCVFAAGSAPQENVHNAGWRAPGGEVNAVTLHIWGDGEPGAAASVTTGGLPSPTVIRPGFTVQMGLDRVFTPGGGPIPPNYRYQCTALEVGFVCRTVKDLEDGGSAFMVTDTALSVFYDGEDHVVAP